MNRHFRIACSIAIFPLLSGCLTTGQTGLGSIDGEKIIYPKSTQPTLVGISKSCPLSTSGAAQPEALAAIGSVLLSVGEAVIPAVSSFVFDRFIEKAEQATLRKTASSTATSNGSPDERLYEISGAGEPNLFANCIVVVRKANAPLPDDYKTAVKAKFPNLSGSLNRAVKGLNLSDDDVPALVMEFRIVPISSYDDKGTPIQTVGMRLRPTAVAYGETGAREVSDKNSKDVVVALTLEGFLPESGKLSQKTIYSHDFPFEKLKIGTVEKYDLKLTRDDKSNGNGSRSPSLLGKAGPIVPMPSPSFKVGKATRSVDVPLTANVVVTEVEEGGDLARALIKAVEEKKGDITKPIDSTLTDLLESLLGKSEDEGGDSE